MRHAAWHAACCALTQAAFVGAGRCAMHAKVFVSMSKQSNVAGRGPLPSSRRMQGPAQADAVAHKLVIQLPPPWHGTPLSTARMPTPFCCVSRPCCVQTLQAVRLGLSGFGAGLSVGKALIEEQACLLNGLLSYSSSLLGSPCKQCSLLQCWVLRWH